MITNIKQKTKKIEPRIKLNYNIYTSKLIADRKNFSGVVGISFFTYLH